MKTEQVISSASPRPYALVRDLILQISLEDLILHFSSPEIALAEMRNFVIIDL
jgi:hypothetical protein